MKSICRVIGAVVLLTSAAEAQMTERLSVDSAGAQGSGLGRPATSLDGRYVAFESYATLVPNDSNNAEDLFVRDRQSGTTERVSVDSSGVEGNDASYDPSISFDGRFVTFASDASNLVAGDTNGVTDIFVHDRETGTTECVSVDSSGVLANGYSYHPAISGDSRYVAFSSGASNLVPSDTNGWWDVFVHDRQTGLTTRVSVDSSGLEANSSSDGVLSISANGQYVAFGSSASNLVPGTTFFQDVYVHDCQSGATTRVSVDSFGMEGNGTSDLPSISADGNLIAFASYASNLVAGDTNQCFDVFLHNQSTGLTERVSVDSFGAEGNDISGAPSLSLDGLAVAFFSLATNLVPGDTNQATDVFVRDVQHGLTKRVSVDSSGQQGYLDSRDPSISADGRYVVFPSDDSNLVPGDTNGLTDIFLHGPYLTLEADPQTPPAGATLALSTWTGEPSDTSLLVVTDANGSPVFIPVVLGSFDSAGDWTITGTVPPGLSGTSITFEAFGIVPTGKVQASNEVAVTFQ